ncbi:3TM-type holin [Vibrio sp. ER1A]|uniref:3TM-type holin n=1 Tax=Vibrio sp. ER1A TaxID=1517681 RepID=UPI0004DD5EDC|nr:3TM-type holin [Vibrio sp. ER1A]KFA99471.1 hypothetical protein HW45_03675 [Vibrio sp. ER1A]
MWETVKKLIGSAAPIIGTVIGGPLGAGIGAMVANELGVEDTPEAIEQALKSDPKALAKIKELEITHKTKLEELALEHAKIEAATTQLQITEQNKTARTELASNDAYVRRWRPTFGYTLCFSWAISFLAIFIASVVHPSSAAEIIGAFVALTPLFSVALAVLGVNIHKRSLDKQTEKGLEPKSIIGLIRGNKNAQS